MFYYDIGKTSKPRERFLGPNFTGGIPRRSVPLPIPPPRPNPRYATP